eukprot:1003162-Amphidinium_carterae.1
MLRFIDLGAIVPKVIAKEVRQYFFRVVPTSPAQSALTSLTRDPKALAITIFWVNARPPNNLCGIDPANKLWSRYTAWASNDEGIAPVEVNRVR